MTSDVFSTRRRCDVTSLEPAHLYSWVASQGGERGGGKPVVVFEMIGILKESNIPPFFEHNLRFLSYSTALCIQINRLQSKGQA